MLLIVSRMFCVECAVEISVAVCLKGLMKLAVVVCLLESHGRVRIFDDMARLKQEFGVYQRHIH